jgi:exopolysaccharide production protein ExoQ
MFQVLSGPSSLTQHRSSARAQSAFSVPQNAEPTVKWNPIQIFDLACLMLLILGGTVPILFPATGTVGADFTPTGQLSGFFRVLYNAISASFLIFFFISGYRNRFQIPIRFASIRFLCAFVVYAAGSLLWGVSPLTPTLGGLMLLTGMLIFAVYLFMQYPPQQLHILLGDSFAILAGSSILMAVVLPQYGVDTTGNNRAWQGVFGQKNQLGTAMVLSLVCALTMPTKNRSWRIALVAVTLIPLAFSQSRESWIAAAACLLTFGLTRGVFRFGSRDRLFMIAAAAIFLVAIGAVVALNEREFLALMGRNATFSGRTKVWSAVLHLVAQRPFLGYGLAGASGTTIWASVEAETGWRFGSGRTHSIYLDSLFRFGLVGSAILLSALFLGVRHILKVLASGTAAQIEFPMLLLLGMLVCGIGGHGLFEIPGVQLILFFLALFMLDREANPRTYLRAE